MEQKNLIKLSKKSLLLITLIKLNLGILVGLFSASFGLTVYNMYGALASILGTAFCFFVSMACASHIEQFVFGMILVVSANGQGVDIEKVADNKEIINVQIGDTVMSFDFAEKKWIE